MDEDKKKVIKVPVKDKRRLAQEGNSAAPVDEQPFRVADGEPESADEPQLSVDELQRLKADLENTRKRMIREQSRALEYAAKDVMKRLIPVIDHFRLAMEHGEGGSGIELAMKELMDALAAEGLEEIDVAQGTPFDPTLHHALATHPDPEVEVDTVKQVHRTGFRFKDHILRAPEVLVAQPVEQEVKEGTEQ